MATTGNATTIQLGTLYRTLAADFEAAGLHDTKYCLDVEWWNYRHETPDAPTLKVWVNWIPEGAFYEAPTADAVLALVRAAIAERKACVEVAL